MTATLPAHAILLAYADASGLCNGRNQGIAESHMTGLISSATLMVNGKACEEAVKQAQEIGLPLGMAALS